MKAWRTHMMPWAPLGFQIKLHLKKKLCLSGQREFTGPGTVTDVIKCFISEITLRRRAVRAAVGLHLWKQRTEGPLTTLPYSVEFHWRYPDFCWGEGEKIQAISVHTKPQCDLDHRCWAHDRSSWNFSLTSGDIKHPFPVSFCWVATVFIWQLLESYPV